MEITGLEDSEFSELCQIQDYRTSQNMELIQFTP